MYWDCRCVCECDLELVMEYPGSSVVTIRHEGEEDSKQISIRQIFLQNLPLLSHVSISHGFLTGSLRYLWLGSDLFLWPDVGFFFIWGRIFTGLPKFCLILLTWTATTQRNPEGGHGHGTVTHEWGAVSDRNSSHLISDQGEDGYFGGKEFFVESLCHEPSVSSF